MKKRRETKPKKRRKPAQNKAADVSGMFGERVSVRKVNNRVVVTNRPKRKKGKLTEALSTQRKQFKKAVLYAQAQQNNPELRALYARRIRGKHESAYTVALADYLNPPKVDLIEIQQYRGAIGNTLTIHAFDGFEVTKVEVIIMDAKGVVLEEGEASLNPVRPSTWEYKTVVANPSFVGTRIIATAYDRPGNTGTLEVVL